MPSRVRFSSRAAPLGTALRRKPGIFETESLTVLGGWLVTSRAEKPG
jgi:hypothetical protein